jgi:nucleoside-diphosphate-sugar epimerase
MATDAGDFIGSWIVKILLARGYAVRAPPATQIGMAAASLPLWRDGESALLTL